MIASITSLTIDAYSGLSDRSLKASLAAVIDQCSGRLRKWREGKMRKREQGRDDEGRGPQRPCHFNLLYAVYLEKLCCAPKIEGPFSLLPGQRKEGGAEGGRRRRKGGVELYSTVSHHI